MQRMPFEELLPQWESIEMGGMHVWIGEAFDTVPEQARCNVHDISVFLRKHLPGCGVDSCLIASLANNE
jgi:hypothetical protein